MIEKKYDTKILSEVKKLCDYLSDECVKEVTTYRSQIAGVFEYLGYDVKVPEVGLWVISRKKVSVNDDGYWM